MSIMKIPHTLNIISLCWQQAEENLQEKIQKYYPRKGEEFITEQFHGMFAEILDLASQDKKIERAFSRDLRKAFPDVHSYDIDKISRGLIAQAILHKRKTEETTGADIGLAINRPAIENHGNIFKINSYRRGLLCQAKLRKVNKKWNTFTETQEKVLADRLDYLGLLLYKYVDKERRELKPFQWQLCQGASNIVEVTNWLKAGEFPSTLESEKIIKALGEGRIGTSDKKILDEFITPEKNTSLEIIIKWDDDAKKPGSEIRTYTTGENKHENEQSVFIKR